MGLETYFSTEIRPEIRYPRQSGGPIWTINQAMAIVVEMLDSQG